MNQNILEYYCLLKAMRCEEIRRMNRANGISSMCLHMMKVRLPEMIYCC